MIETESVVPHRGKRGVADFQRNASEQSDRTPTRQKRGPGKERVKTF